MKLKILLLCILTQFVNLQAQTSAPKVINTENPGSVTGKIIDKKTNEPIPYASVTIKDGATILSGAITKENGTFAINNLSLKELTIEVQFMGYKKHISTFSLSSDSKNIALKTIALEEESTMLDAVSIVKDRSSIEQKIDRKVITVGKDLVAAGTTASEIMNNIPTVSVDPQTKELSLRGNTNVRVLIDGKPTNIDATQLLQQIPSSSIKQIELITNPSAKYNPEGMSGIINIILHKNAQNGFNGSLNTGVTFGKTPKLNTALNLNYKVGKVNIYSNYGLNHGENKNHGNITSLRPTLENDQDFEFNNLNTSHLLKLGVDYFINEKNTLSFYTNHNIVDGKGNGLTLVDYYDNNTYILDNPDNPNPIDLNDPTTFFTKHNRDSKQLFNSESDNKTQTYDLDFKHDFTKKGENVEFQVNFSNTKDDENTSYDTTEYSPDSNSLKNNIVDETTNSTQINIDYVNPLTETTKLELGAETRIQATKSNFYETIDNTAPYSASVADYNFTFNRNVSAVYANYSKQWKKWSGQFGLRVENYAIDGDFERNEEVDSPPDPITTFHDTKKLEDKIFTFYPSVFFTYTASEKNSFNFNYSRRVDRPSLGQISPIREWTTPLVESRGNANLKPQFTNSFEANYTRTVKIGSITSGVFYRQINDEIGRVIYKNPTNDKQDIISYDNFDNNNAFGMEASANLKFTKWWSMNASADAYFKTVKGTVQNANTLEMENGQVDVVSFNTRVNNTFTATSKLKFQLFGMYRGSDLGLQFKRKPMYKTDLGATYSVLKGKGTITARMNDVFDTMHFSFDGGIPYKQVGAFYWESHTFYVGFNLVFGGGKNRALQRKQRDDNETQGGGGLL